MVRVTLQPNMPTATKDEFFGRHFRHRITLLETFRVLMELYSNQEMRSKANPRSFVFTIGFSAESACRGQGTKTNAKANAEAFLIDTGIGSHSVGVSLRDLCPKVFLLSPPTRM
jgi:hypothetical protein